MLVFGEEAGTFHMLHNMLYNDGFHSLACNAGEETQIMWHLWVAKNEIVVLRIP